jgi:hypothetical protein
MLLLLTGSVLRSLDLCFVAAHYASLVIVHKLNLVGIAIAPAEADTKLVIDPYAVLSFPVCTELLQPIAWRSCEIAQFAGGIQLPKFSTCDLLECLEAATALAIVKSLSLRTPKRLDHRFLSVFWVAFNVNQKGSRSRLH